MNIPIHSFVAVVLTSLAAFAARPDADFHCRTVTRAPVPEVRSVELHLPGLEGAERGASNGVCAQRNSSVTFTIVTAAESEPSFEKLKEKNGAERYILQAANGQAERVAVRAITFLGQKVDRFRLRGFGVDLMADARDSEMWVTSVRSHGHLVFARATYPASESEKWVSRLDSAVGAAKITIHDDLSKPPGPKYMPSVEEAARRLVSALNAGDVDAVMKTVSEPSPGLVREDCIARRDWVRALVEAKRHGGSKDRMGLGANAEELAPEFEMLNCDRIAETNAALVRFVSAKGGGVRLGEVEPDGQRHVFQVIPPGAAAGVVDELNVAGPAPDKLVIASGHIRGLVVPFVASTSPPPAANLWMAFPQLRRWAIAEGFAPPR